MPTRPADRPRSPFARTCRLMTAGAAAALVAGCAAAPSGGPDAPKVVPETPAAPRPGVTPAGVPGPAPTAAKPTSPDTPVVPKDARYTIVCVGFTGPSHVQQAKVSKDNLIKATGRREFYVIHDDAQSTVYFGYYRERERLADPAEAARAAKDLEFIRSLANLDGQRLFTASLIMPLPQPDAVAPPEFDITRVDADKSADDPTRRCWSIAIADYSNDVVIDGKGRKQIVVEAVIEARRRGVEAYYYNGPNASTVCIGAWPRRAVRPQEADRAESLRDSGQEIVVSDHKLRDDEMSAIQQSGRDIKVMEKKVVIDDPVMMKALTKDYTEYSLNGRLEMLVSRDPKTGEETRKPKDTFLFEIPRTAQPPAMLATDPRPPAGETPNLLNPLTPSARGTGGSGRLRSVTP